MKLNSDLGEGDPAADALLMPHVHLASIACGGHAGDARSMAHTVELACLHGVRIGAHPGYPDREGFGRREFSIQPADLAASLLEQMRALQAVCRQHGRSLEYVKPHGALYNTMMRDPGTFTAVLEAVRAYGTALPIVVQAGAPMDNQAFTRRAGTATLWFEAFADRGYAPDGGLVPRSTAGAVYEDPERIVEQANDLVRSGAVTAPGGRCLHVQADTLCVHGDNPASVAAAPRIRALLAGI